MTDYIAKISDSRRLTGPNLFWNKAGAILDVHLEKINKDEIISLWKLHCRTLLDSLGWQTEEIITRKYANGASLIISAPIDCLYTATEITEEAWHMTINDLQLKTNDLDASIKRLVKEITKEQNPKLIELQQAASKRHIKFLTDDDEVSIGYGKSCQIFPVNNIPLIESINWQQVKDIPVAMVTGTNGKSTTVRLASSVVKAAGLRCGITSTDYIRVADKVLDTGDYSGPGGARTLLRHPETEVALLEVARGGMLRRGLGVNQATTVLVTNVAEDHLGEYGIYTLSDMVEAKFTVRQSITKTQNLILNADDPGSVKFAQTLDNTIVWFSWFSDNIVIQNHINNNGTVCYVENNDIYFQQGAKKQFIITINEIPITLNGAAKHNIHNALSVVALCFSLGFDQQEIALGLKRFENTPENNPGRGNLFEFSGIKVIVDFAHNEHGLKLMAQTIKNMPAKRRLVMMGQAGDRSDELIEGLVKSAMQASPDMLVICEMKSHLRGRKIGEIPALIQKYALKHGMQKTQLIHASDTIDGTEKSINWAQKDDILLILALTNREKIIEILYSIV